MQQDKLNYAENLFQSHTKLQQIKKTIFEDL
jgi:hypothetical protein